MIREEATVLKYFGGSQEAAHAHLFLLKNRYMITEAQAKHVFNLCCTTSAENLPNRRSLRALYLHCPRITATVSLSCI